MSFDQLLRVLFLAVLCSIEAALARTLGCLFTQPAARAAPFATAKHPTSNCARPKLSLELSQLQPFIKKKLPSQSPVVPFMQPREGGRGQG
jgi:hypothetical protein